MFFTLSPNKKGWVFGKISEAALTGITDIRFVKDKRNQVIKTLAKAFLISAPVLFAISLTGPGDEFLWGFLKPLSALLFVNFFIMNLLVKEYDEYDEEYDLRMALAQEVTGEPVKTAREPIGRTATPQATFAH